MPKQTKWYRKGLGNIWYETTPENELTGCLIGLGILIAGGIFIVIFANLLDIYRNSRLGRWLINLAVIVALVVVGAIWITNQRQRSTVTLANPSPIKLVRTQGYPHALTGTLTGDTERLYDAYLLTADIINRDSSQHCAIIGITLKVDYHTDYSYGMSMTVPEYSDALFPICLAANESRSVNFIIGGYQAGERVADAANLLTWKLILLDGEHLASPGYGYSNTDLDRDIERYGWVEYRPPQVVSGQ